jgi:hypothetical protein
MAEITTYAPVTTLNEAMLFFVAIDTDADGTFESRNMTLAILRESLYGTASKMVKLSKGADIASANALVLVEDGNYFDITGTTSITSIGTVQIGTQVTFQFDASLTLTHHATDLILPTGKNIQTEAGDHAVFVEYATGDWRCISYTRAAALVRSHKGADVASAAALPVLKDGNYFDVTGTTAITSINTLGVGTQIVLQFDAALTFTHHATDLILPNGDNITTAAGDHMTLVEYDTGKWRLTSYMPYAKLLIDLKGDLTPQLGGPLDANGKQIKMAKGADVASAAALPVLTDGNYFDVTGTAAITSIDTMGVGTQIILQFDAALTLTHHATDLILPSGANIVTAAGDHAVFVEYATGDWRCVGYFRASALPELVPASGVRPIMLAAAMDNVTDTAACSVANYFSTLTTTGAAVPTLADGVENQIKKVQMIVHVGDAVLTPANLTGGTTITFADVGDVAELIFISGSWQVVALYNLVDGATAPVLA